MKIQEAIKKALAEDKYISNDGLCKMKPDKYLPFEIRLRDGSNPVKYWNITVGELLSDEWKVVD